MVSSTLPQVLSTAVDGYGLSTITSVRSPTDPRPGAAYDHTVMAAAVPIYFHTMTSPGLGGANVMMLNSTRWTAATASATDPGRYSSYTVDDLPNWLLVNAANGHSSAVNSGVTIPSSLASDSRVLTSATSHSVDMLYTLLADTDQAVIQHWHNNTAINTLNLINEEIIPVGTNGSDTVIFDAGVHYSSATDPYMYVYGTGSVSHLVYAARKNWARVGSTGILTRSTDGLWEVSTADGWDPDFTKAKPIQDGLTSFGPISVGNYSIPRSVTGRTTSYTFMAVTDKSGSTMTAQIYSNLGGRGWNALGDPIALGLVGSTYLGATAQLQPQIGPNPALINTATAAGAIPYVTAVKNSASGTDQISVSWALLQVPRVL